MLTHFAQVKDPEFGGERSASPPAAIESIWAGAQALLDSLPGQATILDAVGNIVAVNRAWRDFGKDNAGLDGNAWIGHSYILFCQNIPGLEPLADAIADVAAGISSGHVAAYGCSSPKEWRWYQVRVTPLKDLSPFRVLIVHDNVSPAIHALGDVWRDFSTLSPRERQVFDLVARGMANKEIATTLGVAEKTVETHRAAVMVKMRVRSLADLVRRAVAIEVAMGQCKLFGRGTLNVRPNQ